MHKRCVRIKSAELTIVFNSVGNFLHFSNVKRNPRLEARSAPIRRCKKERNLIVCDPIFNKAWHPENVPRERLLLHDEERLN